MDGWMDGWINRSAKLAADCVSTLAHSIAVHADALWQVLLSVGGAIHQDLWVRGWDLVKPLGSLGQVLESANGHASVELDCVRWRCDITTGIVGNHKVPVVAREVEIRELVSKYVLGCVVCAPGDVAVEPHHQLEYVQRQSLGSHKATRTLDGLLAVLGLVDTCDRIGAAAAKRLNHLLRSVMLALHTLQLVLRRAISTLWTSRLSE
ncbi:hypothetical protein BC831DRAFT_140849 [Entophlyctis helioformis]|nr:hypothetical protein BC831DRAFT_140849 [Entophlyctis helioformis]